MSLAAAAFVFTLMMIGLAYAVKKYTEIDVKTMVLDGGAGKERQQHMRRVTSAWDEWPTTQAWAQLSGSCIVELRRGRFFGPMDIDVALGTLSIFDWQVSMPAEHAPGGHFQTVAVFAPVELKAPEFFLQPKDTGLPITLANSWNAYRRLETHTKLDYSHVCEGCFEDPVVMLFQSEIGAQMIEIIASKGWTVEWTGRQLIAFRDGCLVAPNGLRQFAAEVMEFAELVTKAQDAVDARIDQRVQSFFEGKQLQQQ